MNLTKLFGFRRRVPESRNVLQLNKTIDRADSVMDAFTATAKAAGFDLGSDADGIELALVDFFTDRDNREESSALDAPFTGFIDELESWRKSTGGQS